MLYVHTGLLYNQYKYNYSSMPNLPYITMVRKIGGSQAAPPLIGLASIAMVHCIMVCLTR
jgi:hypothetical protein